MRVWGLFLFLCLCSGSFFRLNASLDEAGICLDLSSIPSSNRLYHLANECARLSADHGYVGINLSAFRKKNIDQVLLFSDENTSLSRFHIYFLEKQPSLMPTGYENIFLFLTVKNSEVFADICVASTYHHINNLIMSFRGEGPCYRGILKRTSSLPGLVESLCTKYNKGVSSLKAAGYDRFLESNGGPRLREFLTYFVERRSFTKDTSKPGTLLPERPEIEY